MASHRDIMQEDIRYRVLRLLQDNPEMTQRELAEAVGVSVGAAHYCLNALVQKGMVKLENFTTAKDKRRYAYILTSKGVAEKANLTRRFLRRKVQEYEILKAEIEAIQDELDHETDEAPQPALKHGD